jgi:hypothetical protein
MSRQDFLAGVEKLLGRFDADSFMRGFQTGQQQVIQRLKDWVASFPPDHDFQKTISLAIKNATKKIKR